MDHDPLDSAGEEQETFASGSVRGDGRGKGRWDLLPFGALMRLARVYERGASKYGDRNWELGQPVSRFLASGLRHLCRYLDGQDDEDHLGMAAWNLLGALEMEERVCDGRGRVSPDVLDLPRHDGSGSPTAPASATPPVSRKPRHEV